jgi:hypothetical protein
VRVGFEPVGEVSFEPSFGEGVAVAEQVLLAPGFDLGEDLFLRVPVEELALGVALLGFADR